MEIVENRLCIICCNPLNAWRSYVMVEKYIERHAWSWKEREYHGYVHNCCMPKWRMKLERP